jgi:hypothetical protein
VFLSQKCFQQSEPPGSTRPVFGWMDTIQRRASLLHRTTCLIYKAKYRTVCWKRSLKALCRQQLAQGLPGPLIDCRRKTFRSKYGRKERMRQCGFRVKFPRSTNVPWHAARYWNTGSEIRGGWWVAVSHADPGMQRTLRGFGSHTVTPHLQPPPSRCRWLLTLSELRCCYWILKIHYVLTKFRFPLERALSVKNWSL